MKKGLLFIALLILGESALAQTVGPFYCGNCTIDPASPALSSSTRNYVTVTVNQHINQWTSTTRAIVCNASLCQTIRKSGATLVSSGVTTNNNSSSDYVGSGNSPGSSGGSGGGSTGDTGSGGSSGGTGSGTLSYTLSCAWDGGTLTCTRIYYWSP